MIFLFSGPGLGLGPLRYGKRQHSAQALKELWPARASHAYIVGKVRKTSSPARLPLWQPYLSANKVTELTYYLYLFSTSYHATSEFYFFGNQGYKLLSCLDTSIIFHFPSRMQAIYTIFHNTILQLIQSFKNQRPMGHLPSTVLLMGYKKSPFSHE